MLTDRQSAILFNAVKLYIQSGKPVASADVAEQLRGKWSPATIRKEMKLLEEMGYFEHPYKVAGRIPTVKAYRWFFSKVRLAPLWDEADYRVFRRILREISDFTDVIRSVVNEVASFVRELSVATYSPKGAKVVEVVAPVVGVGKRMLGIVLSTGDFIRVIVPQDVFTDSDLEYVRSVLIGKSVKDVVDWLNAAGEPWADELVRRMVAYRYVESGLEYILGMGVDGLRFLLNQVRDPSLYQRMDIVPAQPIFIASEDITNSMVKDWFVMLMRYCRNDVEGFVGVVGPRDSRIERSIELLWSVKKALEEKNGNKSV